MELIAILRVLWGRRLYCIPGVLAAIAVTAFYATKPLQLGGFASVGVLLDTNPSQLVKPLPAGAESLGWRAQMLATVMTDIETRNGIARELRVQPEAVRLLEPTLQAPLKPTAIARSAAGADGLAPAYLVATVVANQNLGTLAIEAYAPDRAAARRLAAAVANGAKRLSEPSIAGAAASPTATPDRNAAPTPTPVPPEYGLGTPRDTDIIQPYTVSVGAITARTQIIAGPKGKAVVSGGVVLAFWIALVLVAPGAYRRVRGAGSLAHA